MEYLLKWLVTSFIVGSSVGLLVLFVFRNTFIARDVIGPLLVGSCIGVIILALTLPTAKCVDVTASINDIEYIIGKECTYKNKAGIVYQTDFKATATQLIDSNPHPSEMTTPVQCAKAPQCIYYIAPETGLEITEPVAPVK